MQIKDESLVKKLEKTGFTDKEALVYVSLLELNGAYPSKVAKYCGLKRATTYDVLTVLAVRGIVNEIEKKNKLFYQIEKPEKIVKYTQNQADKALDAVDTTKGLIPEISNIINSFKNNSKTTYYEGIEGILSIYDDMVDVKKPYEMLIYSRANELVHGVSKKFIEDYIEKKIKAGITTRTLVPDTASNRNHLEIYKKGTPEKFYPVIKYITPEKFDFNGEIVIYGDSKIAITNLGENKLMGVIMEDKAINKIMRVIFELSWNSTLVRE